MGYKSFFYFLQYVLPKKTGIAPFVQLAVGSMAFFYIINYGKMGKSFLFILQYIIHPWTSFLQVLGKMLFHKYLVIVDVSSPVNAWPIRYALYFTCMKSMFYHLICVSRSPILPQHFTASCYKIYSHIIFQEVKVNVFVVSIAFRENYKVRCSSMRKCSPYPGGGRVNACLSSKL